MPPLQGLKKEIPIQLNYSPLHAPKSEMIEKENGFFSLIVIKKEDK